MTEEPSGRARRRGGPGVRLWTTPAPPRRLWTAPGPRVLPTTAPHWTHASDRVDPPPGPRRVLRLGRAARQALPARQARRRRRRRTAGRRVHGVLRGSPLRCPLGDEHGRGPLPVSPRRLPRRTLRGVPGRVGDRDGAAAPT